LFWRKPAVSFSLPPNLEYSFNIYVAKVLVGWNRCRRYSTRFGDHKKCETLGEESLDFGAESGVLGCHVAPDR
jgi:hypothetical protein